MQPEKVRDTFSTTDTISRETIRVGKSVRIAYPCKTPYCRGAYVLEAFDENREPLFTLKCIQCAHMLRLWQRNTAFRDKTFELTPYLQRKTLIREGISPASLAAVEHGWSGVLWTTGNDGPLLAEEAADVVA